MNESYFDIRSRIAEPPKWWDENAVPRYDDFVPGRIANIYADECALVRIACQNCGHEFDVAMSSTRTGAYKIAIARGEVPDEDAVRRYSVAGLIRSGAIHYGDPPNVECCPSGPTMNCDDLRVLQFWRRDRFDWTRDEMLEIALPDECEVRQ